MEHEQAEQEHDQAQEQADALEAEAGELEEEKERFGEQVDELKQDWERKQQAEDVPGAQGEGGDAPADQAPATEED